MIFTNNYFLLGIGLFSLIIVIIMHLEGWKKDGFFSFFWSIIFMIIIHFSLYLFTLALTIFNFFSILNYSKGSIYDAKIISYRSYTNQQTDSHSKRRFSVTYHVPMFEFFVKNQKLQVESSTHSAKSIPIVGNKIKISYSREWSTIVEHSFLNYFISFIFFVLNTFLCFASFVLTANSLRWTLKYKTKIAIKILKMDLILLQLFLIFSLYSVYINLIQVSSWNFIFLIMLTIILFLILSMVIIKKQP